MSERLIEPRSKRVRLTPREFKSPSLLHKKGNRMFLFVDIMGMFCRGSNTWKPYRSSEREKIEAVLDENLRHWTKCGEEENATFITTIADNDSDRDIYSCIEHVDGGSGLLLTEESSIKAYTQLKRVSPEKMDN
jgi:hypothetical protein